MDGRCPAGWRLRSGASRAREGGSEPHAGHVRTLLILLGVSLFAAAAILVALRHDSLDAPAVSSPAPAPDRPTAGERRGRPASARGAPGEGEIRFDAAPPLGGPTPGNPAPGDPAPAAEPPVAVAAPTRAETGAPIARSADPVSTVGAKPAAADPLPPSPPQPGSPPEEVGDEEPIRRDLSGWVFDQAGEPVAGLEVGAVARRLAPASAAAAAMADRRRMTNTNENGHFGFPRLLDGEYEVRTADTESYEPAFAVLRAGVDSAVLVVTAKTGRSILVHGLVESTRGEPLAGVRVIPVERPSSAARSDRSGYYEVRLPVDGRRPGHTLRFVHDGYRELRHRLVGSELAGIEELELDARLEPVAGQVVVTGSVTGSDGLAVHGARLQLYSALLKRRETAVSGRDGRFAFPRVEPASDYRLWVRPRRGYKDHVEEGLIVGPTGRNLAVVVEALELATLRGRMIDPDGAPVPGVSLWLRTAHEGSQRAAAVTGGAGGEFLVERLPEGPVALQTHATPHFSFSGIDLAPGVVNRARLVLDTGRYELDGFVLDSGGVPVPGAQVSLLWSRRDSGVLSRSHRQTTTDANGYFLFTQLGSGRHTLAASARRYRGARLDRQVGADGTKVLIYLLEDSG